MPTDFVEAYPPSHLLDDCHTDNVHKFNPSQMELLTHSGVTSASTRISGALQPSQVYFSIPSSEHNLIVICYASTIGKIAISFLNASANGYVRKTFDGQNSYTKGNLANALQVSIPSSTSAGPFELTALNGPDSAYPFVGAVGGSGGYNMRPGSLG
jgi:hypothetical protein